MNTFALKTLQVIEQSSASWRPKALAKKLGVETPRVTAALRHLLDEKRVARDPLPGHNQFAYRRLDAPTANPSVFADEPARVIWSYGEQAILLAETHRLLQAKLGLSFRDALHEAQNALPPNRRRAKLLPRANRRLRAQYEAMDKAAIPTTAPPQPPAATPEPANDAVAALPEDAIETIEDAPPRVDPLADKLHELIDAITVNIADRLLDTLTARIERSIAQLQFDRSPPRPAATPKTPKPRIVVAGLKGGQITEIAKAISPYADVSFWGAHESPHQLKALCRNADRVYLMTNFVGHSHEDVIRSVAPNRLVRVSGGMTTLRDHIQNASLQ